MTIYTPPALNAVDFALTPFTPEILPANDSALSAYTVPALTNVDFALVAYTQPTFPSVDFELADSAPATQTITGVGFTNTSTFQSGTFTTEYQIGGAGFTNSQVFDAGTLASSYEIGGVSFTNVSQFASGVITQSGEESTVYDGDYVDKYFYKQYIKKKQKEQELLESIQIFPPTVKKSPPILENDESELIMIFAELLDD